MPVMASLGFVARMANWLRGHHELESSPYDVPEEAEAAEATAVETAIEAAERIQLLDPPITDDMAPTSAARFDPAGRSQAVMQELMVRFTGATEALADIRNGLTGLEESFEELPEVVRTQTRFLSAITDQLQRHEVHLGNLSTVLRDLPQTNIEQARTLQRTNDLIAQGRRDLGPLAGGLHRMANTMQGLNESSDRHLACLGILTERHERYLREQREAFRKHNRLVVAILATTGVIALGGVILGLLAILK
jgi:hypothetical protein